MRHGFYPGRVLSGKMSQADMDREIGQMQEAATSIERMAKDGLFKKVYAALGTARTLSSVELVADMHKAQERANIYAEARDLSNGINELVKLAGITLALAELMQELVQMPQPAEQAQASHQFALPQMPVPAAVAQQELGDGYASAEQRKSIIALLNHPAISRPEKTKQLLNINRRTPEQAEQILAKLKAVIDKHDGPTDYKAAA